MTTEQEVLKEETGSTITPTMLQELLGSACVDLCRMDAAGRLGGTELLRMKVAQIRSIIKALDVPGARNKSESELAVADLIKGSEVASTEIKLD